MTWTPHHTPHGIVLRDETGAEYLPNGSAALAFFDPEKAQAFADALNEREARKT